MDLDPHNGGCKGQETGNRGGEGAGASGIDKSSAAQHPEDLTLVTQGTSIIKNLYTGKTQKRKDGQKGVEGTGPVGKSRYQREAPDTNQGNTGDKDEQTQNLSAGNLEPSRGRLRGGGDGGGDG